MSANKTFTHAVPLKNAWTLNNFGSITHGTSLWVSNFSDSVVYGPNDPHWRARIRAGEAVITSLDGTKCSINPSHGFCVNTQGSAQMTVSGYLLMQSNGDPGGISSSGLDITAATSASKSKAAVAFAKSYRKRTRQWQSGVFALELVKTAAMIANPAKSLRKASDLLVSRASKSGRRALAGKTLAEAKAMPRGPQKTRILKAYRRALSDTYLEWVFGVKPTIQDALDAGTAFRAMASGRTFDTVRCRGDGNEQRSAAETTTIFSPCSGFGGAYGCRETSRRTFEFDTRFIGAWKNQNPSQLMPVPKAFGLEVLDVLPTGWEVIPFSWLLDYFVNIGDVLDAWQMRFVTFSWMVELTRSELRETIIPPPDFNDGAMFPRIITVSATPTVLYKRTVKRSASSSAFETDFLVKIPGMGSKKMLNIAALAASLTHGGFLPPSRLRI